MATPGDARIMRIRYDATTSASARWATIAPADHHDGEGVHWRSSALRDPINASIESAVLRGTSSGSRVPRLPRIRSMYCSAVSGIGYEHLPPFRRVIPVPHLSLDPKAQRKKRKNLEEPDERIHRKSCKSARLWKADVSRVAT